MLSVSNIPSPLDTLILDGMRTHVNEPYGQRLAVKQITSQPF